MANRAASGGLFAYIAKNLSEYGRVIPLRAFSREQSEAKKTAGCAALRERRETGGRQSKVRSSIPFPPREKEGPHSEAESPVR
jgi:hypothetical protein